MGFIRRLLLFWKRQEETKEEMPEPEKRKCFSEYMEKVPEVVTYFRRQKGLARREMELVLIDDGQRPAYQICRIAGLLTADIKLFYILTERQEAFEEFAQEAMEEQGLLVVLLTEDAKRQMPGNLILDVRDWENHLDIISAVSYNTIIM